MRDETTEKEIADLAEKLGLSKPGYEPEPLKSALFQADFGFSIDLPALLTMLLLFSIVFFLIVYVYTKKSN